MMTSSHWVLIGEIQSYIIRDAIPKLIESLFGRNTLVLANLELLNPSHSGCESVECGLQQSKAVAMGSRIILINQPTFSIITSILQRQFQIHLNIKNQAMADIVRVKAKKNYEWHQDSKYVYVNVPMPGLNTIKNVEIFLSDVILRLTSKVKKSVETLDFAREVDYLSSDNKFTVVDGAVNAVVKKAQPGQQWDSLLIEGIALTELKARRQESQAKYQENIKQILENKQKMKNQYDRMATKQLMRFEAEERKKLEKKKEQEKQAALKEVFSNINEQTGRFQLERNKWDEKGNKALQLLEKEEEAERKRIAEEKKKQKERKLIEELKDQSAREIKEVKKTQNTMFTEQDIQHYDQLRDRVQEEMQIEEVPVRKQAKVNLKFSDKVYPHVAARDYHYTEAPMPKGSTVMPPPQGDIQNRNPLWLKDKGDRFMHDKNYSAAIDVYSQALRIDGSQTKARMNRSLAHMKSLNLDSAINDCEAVLIQMQKQLLNNTQSKQESLRDLIKIKTRKAICLAWKGKFQSAKQLLKQQLDFPLEQQHKAQILDCLNLIENREKSLDFKLRADEKFKRNNYNEAITLYNQSIDIDQNEYAISNKCLCLNKLNLYQQSIKTADQGIAKIQQFTGKGHKKTTTTVTNTSNDEITANLLLKLLYRKSKALEESNNLKQAEATLLSAINIKSDDKDVKEALRLLKNKQSSIEFYSLKEQASVKLTKESNPDEALKIYTKCLKLLQSMNQNHQEYLSILQNQCVCYLKLQQFDSIIATSIRILNIVNNLKSKIVEFGLKKAANTPSKQDLNKIAIRTLMRRANAYLKTNQIYNAKGDLQKAAEIDPTDQNVVKQLEKLKASISVPVA